MSLTTDPYGEVKLRIIPFDGDRSKWSIWSRKFLAKSSRKGLKKYYFEKQNVEISSSLKGEDLKKRKEKVDELKAEAGAAFDELMLSIDTEASQGRVVFELIMQSVSNDFEYGDPKVAWEALVEKFAPTTAPARSELQRKLYTSKLKRGEDPEEFITECESLRARLKDVGFELKDKEFLIHIMNSLNSDYINEVKILEAQEMMGKEISLDNVKLVTRLQYYRMKDSKKAKSEMALYASSQFKGTCNFCGKYGHKAVDCKQKKKKGKDNKKNQDNKKDKDKKKKFTGKCIYCDKVGHKWQDCFLLNNGIKDGSIKAPSNNNANNNDEEANIVVEEEVALFCEVILGNEEEKTQDQNFEEEKESKILMNEKFNLRVVERTSREEKESEKPIFTDVDEGMSVKKKSPNSHIEVLNGANILGALKKSPDGHIEVLYHSMRSDLTDELDLTRSDLVMGSETLQLFNVQKSKSIYMRDNYYSPTVQDYTIMTIQEDDDVYYTCWPYDSVRHTEWLWAHQAHMDNGTNEDRAFDRVFEVEIRRVQENDSEFGFVTWMEAEETQETNSESTDESDLYEELGFCFLCDNSGIAYEYCEACGDLKSYYSPNSLLGDRLFADTEEDSYRLELMNSRTKHEMIAKVFLNDFEEDQVRNNLTYALHRSVHKMHWITIRNQSDWCRSAERALRKMRVHNTTELMTYMPSINNWLDEAMEQRFLTKELMEMSKVGTTLLKEMGTNAEINTSEEEYALVVGEESALTTVEGDVWIGDSGASCHLTNNEDGFVNWKYIDEHVRVGSGKTLKVTKVGDKKVRVYQKDGSTSVVTLKNVKFVPELWVNLLSIVVALKNGFSISNKGAIIQIEKDGAKIVFDEII